MGSMFSSVDETINSIIFCPPDTPENYFELMNTKRSCLIKLNEKNDSYTPVVIVKPSREDYTDGTDYTDYTNVIDLKRKCIVYSHGNGCDIFGMYDYFKELSDALNVVVVGYDYVGYGLSRKTTPTEKNCYLSMEQCMSHVFSMGFKQSQIYLVGQSLGTGVTMDYASKNNWQNPIILISPYKSICRVAVDSAIVSCVDKFETKKKLPKVNCPIKIFHGIDDKLIHIDHGRDVYDNLQNKTFQPVWLEGVGHNDILNKITVENYLEVLNHE